MLRALSGRSSRMGLSTSSRLAVLVPLLALVGVACGSSASSVDESGKAEGGPTEDADAAAGGESSTDGVINGLEAVTWRHQGVLPSDHFIPQADAELGDAIAERSDGKVTIEMNDGSGLGIASDEVLRAVGDGLIDVARVWWGHVEGDFPQGVVTQLPFLVPYDVDLRKEVSTELRSYYDEILADSNVVVLSLFQADPRNVYATRPIESLEDLEGLQFRSEGGMEAEFTEKLGMGAATIGWEETYTALQQGVVDGFWAPHTATLSMGLDEVVTHAWETQQAGSGNALIVNKDVWDALPTEAQDMILAEAEASTDGLWESLVEVNEGARSEMKEAGVTVTSASDEDIEVMSAAASEVWDWWAERTPDPGPEMLEVTREIVSEQRE